MSERQRSWSRSSTSKALSLPRRPTLARPEISSSSFMAHLMGSAARSFCPWVGNVVGVRNYRYFVAFLSTTNLLALHVMVTSIMVAAHEADTHGGLEKFVEQEPAPGVALVGLVIYSIIILCCVGGLCSYHANLIASNHTTNEEIKSTYGRAANPHDRGCARNCASFCCEPQRKSYVHSMSVATGARETSSVGSPSRPRTTTTTTTTTTTSTTDGLHGAP